MGPGQEPVSIVRPKILHDALALGVAGQDPTASVLFTWARRGSWLGHSFAKDRSNLMNAVVYPFETSPRCSATSKRTKERCKAPAVRGVECMSIPRWAAERRMAEQMAPTSTDSIRTRRKRRAD
jgi:hypothetical protein